MSTEAIIAAVVGAIAAILAAILGKTRAFKPCVKVTRVKNPAIEDFHVAMELYARRLPEDELCSPEDTVRWLQEAQEGNKNGTSNIEEFFLIANLHYEKHKSEVCGLMYFTYYPTSNPPLAFISYLVVDDQIPGAFNCRANGAMINEVKRLLKKELKRCAGFVAEVDDPKSPKIKRNRDKLIESKARIRLFRQVARSLHYDIIALDHVPYKQPDLAPPGNRAAEIPMLLLYIPVAKEQKVDMDTIEGILGFVYNDIYGDSFLEDGRQDEGYEKYLLDLKKRVLRGTH
jgi:hypothetical protein